MVGRLSAAVVVMIVLFVMLMMMMTKKNSKCPSYTQIACRVISIWMNLLAGSAQQRSWGMWHIALEI
jgi:F0F1-type ATP synthase membrane subunit a